MTFYQCSGSASGSGSVRSVPYVFGPPGAASGSVRQRYGSEDPDPHPDPYQNRMSRIYNTGWRYTVRFLLVPTRETGIGR